jgi:hypothetical protein
MQIFPQKMQHKITANIIFLSRPHKYKGMNLTQQNNLRNIRTSHLLHISIFCIAKMSDYILNYDMLSNVLQNQVSKIAGKITKSIQCIMEVEVVTCDSHFGLKKVG